MWGRSLTRRSFQRPNFTRVVINSDFGKPADFAMISPRSLDFPLYICDLLWMILLRDFDLPFPCFLLIPNCCWYMITPTLSKSTLFSVLQIDDLKTLSAATLEHVTACITPVRPKVESHVTF